jgi:uncharacterized protein (DUF362 family)
MSAGATRTKGRVAVAPIPSHATRAAFLRRVGDAIAAAVAAPSAEAAARRLFKPSDTVGIKVNCLAGPRMSPRPEIVEAVVELIAGAGVERSRIIVFERSSRELEQAGFDVRRQGGPHLCYGVDNRWDRRPTVSGEIGSCYARLVSETCTALVSVGVVKDHDLAGVSAGLKNWYGVIHNPNKYHDNSCDPYIADVVRHPLIAGKQRLTVLDGGRAQYRGGPAFAARGVFDLGSVIASADPVAADAWAWRVIDGERSRHGVPSLEASGRAPRFIATAARHGLGIGDRTALEEVQV